MENDLISIIMPAYNAERYVGQAIQSCIEQSYPDFELIVVDDSSTDNTCEIVEGFRDSRVRLIRQDSNQGPGPARNRAIEVSGGEWLTVLDADDCYSTDRLLRLLRCAQHFGKYAIYTDDWFDWQLESQPPTDDRDITTDPLLLPIMEWDFDNWLAVSREARPFFHHDLLKDREDWYPALPAAQDTVFMVRLAVANQCMVRQVLVKSYIYRNTPGSITDGSLSRALACVEAYGLILNSVDESTRPIARQLLREAERNVTLKHLRLSVQRKEFRAATRIVIRHPRVVLTAAVKVVPYVRSRTKKTRLRNFQIEKWGSSSEIDVLTTKKTGAQ